jgi:hypothetical protein
VRRVLSLFLLVLAAGLPAIAQNNSGLLARARALQSRISTTVQKYTFEDTQTGTIYWEKIIHEKDYAARQSLRTQRESARDAIEKKYDSELKAELRDLTALQPMPTGRQAALDRETFTAAAASSDRRTILNAAHLAQVYLANLIEKLGQ